MHPGAVASGFYDELPAVLGPFTLMAKRFMTPSGEAAEAVAWLATTNPDGYSIGRRRPPRRRPSIRLSPPGSGL